MQQTGVIKLQRKYHSVFNCTKRILLLNVQAFMCVGISNKYLGYAVRIITANLVTLSHLSSVCLGDGIPH